MTSLDSLERDLEALESDGANDVWGDIRIVFIDEGGEHRTPEGDPVDPDAGETIIKIGGEPLEEVGP